MLGGPEIFALFIPLLTLLISLGLAVYVIVLLSRLVRAVEKIAENTKK